MIFGWWCECEGVEMDGDGTREESGGDVGVSVCVVLRGSWLVDSLFVILVVY